LCRSSIKDLDVVFEDFFNPQLVSASSYQVAEVGVGGGRIASRVLPRVASLACFDVSSEMLALAEKNVKVISGEDRISDQ